MDRTGNLFSEYRLLKLRMQDAEIPDHAYAVELKFRAAHFVKKTGSRMEMQKSFGDDGRRFHFHQKVFSEQTGSDWENAETDSKKQHSKRLYFIA